jgi:methylmalonyl-CoA/ethylmalonyl-CoA epimerase
MEIDHVGIAVRDLPAAVEEYRRAFGIEPVHRERVEDQGVDEVLFRVGTSYIQLLGPLGSQTPVGRFLERRGEGLHHVGYRVRDVAAAVERFRRCGIALVDGRPRHGSRGTMVAFVHPKGFRGVLVELVQEAGEPGSAGTREAGEPGSAGTREAGEPGPARTGEDRTGSPGVGSE